MPPLTLAILASVLHIQGGDATVTSDNKGVEDLLAPLREQLQQKVDPNSPRIIEASHVKGYYSKTYVRHYLMNYVTAKPGAGTVVRPGGGTPVNSEGSKRR